VLQVANTSRQDNRRDCWLLPSLRGLVSDHADGMPNVLDLLLG
jgi:hypothetical protein